MADATLPSYLDDQLDNNTILQDMISNVDPSLDTSEGGFIWDSLAPTSVELALAAGWAQEVLRRSFTQTTFGQYLDYRGADIGLPRNAAVKATCPSEVINGTAGTLIPAGTRISTETTANSAAVFFTTDADATIGSNGTVTVSLTAEVGGVSGNVAAGTITLLNGPNITGITSLTNSVAASGGIDEELDDDYKARILEAESQESGGGNVADYERWTKEVSGVGYVLVDPLWNGPDTVRVVFLDSNGNIPSSSLVDQVQTYLDPNSAGTGQGKAPIGAKVTVQAPTDVPLTLTVPGLTAATGYTLDQAKTNLEAAANAYILSASPGQIIRIHDLEAAIANAAGVLDFGDILLNGARDNITLAADEKASLSQVTYT